MSKKRMHIPGVWIAVVLLYAISVIFSPNMLSFLQIQNLMKNIPFLAIVAIGQAFAIISGGLDLSVAGIVTSTNVICCLIMSGSNSFKSTALAVCVPLLYAVFIGAVKGIVVAKLKIIPMIATLSINYILQGVALLLVNGVSKGRTSREFSAFAEGAVLDVIPNTFVVLMILVVLFGFMQTRMKFGHALFATGSNRQAAYYSGVKSDMIIVWSYIICSACAAVAGLLLTSYIELPSFDLGEPYSINSIAACVVGGVSMAGGSGTVVGAVGGAVFITLLNSLLNVLKMPSGVQNIVRGMMIIIGLLGSENIKDYLKNSTKKEKITATGQI